MQMPDTSAWNVSLHGTAFLQYVRTSGARATYQFGSVNRVMIEAAGPLAGGLVRLRGMGSVEALTLTGRGAPQPLQVAFISDGKTITDHAHPSPWIMELATSYERELSGGVAVSLYAAAIGEPALGPPAFMHRASAAANPAEPLGHHGQDITHSSFGVLTLGLARGRVRVEGSAFNDRQPSEATTVFFYRGARLDSYSARVTVATGRAWSLAWSYGYLPPAGGGHSHGTIHRAALTAVHDAGPWRATLVYAADDPVGGGSPHRTVLAEGERRWNGGHALFARAEFVQRTAEELSLVGSVSEVQDLGALQVGYARAVWRLGGTPVRIGGYATATRVPPQLEPFYGSRMPLTIAAFAQLRRGD